MDTNKETSTSAAPASWQVAAASLDAFDANWAETLRQLATIDLCTDDFEPQPTSPPSLVRQAAQLAIDNYLYQPAPHVSASDQTWGLGGRPRWLRDGSALDLLCRPSSPLPPPAPMSRAEPLPREDVKEEELLSEELRDELMEFFSLRNSYGTPANLLREFLRSKKGELRDHDELLLELFKDFYEASCAQPILPILLADLMSGNVPQIVRLRYRALQRKQRVRMRKHGREFKQGEQSFQAISVAAAAGFALEALQSLSALVSTFPGGQTLVHFIAFLVSIYDASSWKGVLSALTTFSLSMTTLHPTLADTFKAICHEFTSTLTDSAGDFTFQADVPIWDTLGDLSSALGGVFWEFTSCFSVAGPLVALGIFPDLASWKEFATSKVQPLLRKDVAIETFLEKFVSFNEALWKNFSVFLETGSIKAVIARSQHYAWLKNTEELMDDSRVRVTVTGQSTVDRDGALLTMEERCTRLNLALEEGEAIHKRLEKWGKCPSSTASVAAMLAQLRHNLSNWTNRSSNSGERIPPYCIMLHGAQGIGKTEMVKAFHAVFTRQLGIPGDASSIFTYKPGMKHWDGYNSATTAVWFDDVDKFPTVPSATATWVETFHNVCNSLPYRLIMADVNDKGKYFCNVPIVYFTTNHRTCNLSGLTFDAKAFWRRVNIHVSVTLRPEYMKDPSVPVLDATKMSGPHDPRPWRFEVSRFGEPEGRSGNMPYLVSEQHLELKTEIVDLIRKEIVDHRIRGKERLKANMAPPCGECFQVHGPGECPAAPPAPQEMQMGGWRVGRPQPTQQPAPPPSTTNTISLRPAQGVDRLEPLIEPGLVGVVTQFAIGVAAVSAFSVGAAPASLFGTLFIVASIHFHATSAVARGAGALSPFLRSPSLEEGAAMLYGVGVGSIGFFVPFVGMPLMVAGAGLRWFTGQVRATGAEAYGPVVSGLFGASCTYSSLMCAWFVASAPFWGGVVAMPVFGAGIAFVASPLLRKNPQWGLSMLGAFARRPWTGIQLIRVYYQLHAGDLSGQFLEAQIANVVESWKESEKLFMHAAMAFAGAVTVYALVVKYKKQTQMQMEVEGENAHLVNKGIHDRWALPKARFPMNIIDPLKDVSDVARTVPFREVIRIAQCCQGRVTVDGGKRMSTICVRYEGQWVLFPSHLVCPIINEADGVLGAPYAEPYIKVMFGDPEGEHFMWEGTIILGQTYLPIPGRDLVIAYIPGLHASGGGIVKMLSLASSFGYQRSFDESVLVGPEFEGGMRVGIDPVRADVAFARDGKSIIKPTWGYSADGCVRGVCGSLLIVRRGKDAWVMGLHVGAMLRNNFAFSDELIQTEIEAARGKLLRDSPIVFQASEVDLSQGSGYEIVLGPLHEKSMLNGISVCSAGVVGSITTMNGKKPFRPKDKSAIQPTFFGGEFQEELISMGVDFVPPTFGGRHFEGEFRHPVLVRLKALGGVSSTPLGVTAWAVEDYLTGLNALPGRRDFRPFTNEETFQGIEGGSTGQFDPDTSFGFPVNKKKRTVFPQGWGGPSGPFWPMVHAIEERLRQGKPWVPVLSGSLKDEAVKKAKEDAGKIRMFFAAPFAFNFLLKKYLGPLFAFMGMHKEFFECYVGYNLASASCTSFVHRFTRFGEGRCIDGDISDCDSKAISAAAIIYGMMVLIHLAKHLGYSPEDVEMVRLLCGSLHSVVIHYKGDIIAMCEHNWSGVLWTVWLNVWGLRLQYSIALLLWAAAHNEGIHRGLLDHSSPVRHFLTNGLLGDDTLMNVSPEVDGFDFVWIRDDLATRGITFTPGDKTDGDYSYKHISKVSFLKRRFFFSEELQQWVPRLELASILRSLAWKGATQLGDRDHAAACMESAALEFWMYGRDEYTRRFGQLTRVASQHQIPARLKTFDEIAEDFGQRKFCVWNPGDM